MPRSFLKSNLTGLYPAETLRKGLLLPVFIVTTCLTALSQNLVADTAYASVYTGEFSVKDPGPVSTLPLLLPSYKNWRVPDSLPGKKQTRNRVKWVAAANIAGYGGAMIGLYAAWYSKYEKTGFHAFDDSREWLQMDKVGHVFSAYAESLGSMELWRWTGIDRKKRIWLGGMSGAAYQTVIEVLDGFSEGWGWSWADFGANIIGSGALVAQELAWDEQRIKFKFSFHRKTYDDPELNWRSDHLFGKSAAERLLKDYNGQTYWASMNLKSFFKNSRLPEWLAVSVGYGSEGLFGGRENTGKDDEGNIIFDRPDVPRYRQWFLAPDLDLSRIKTNKKGLKLLLAALSVFKFPAPALEFSRGKFKLRPLYF